MPTPADDAATLSPFGYGLDATLAPRLCLMCSPCRHTRQPHHTRSALVRVGFLRVLPRTAHHGSSGIAPTRLCRTRGTLPRRRREHGRGAGGSATNIQAAEPLVLRLLSGLPPPDGVAPATGPPARAGPLLPQRPSLLRRHHPHRAALGRGPLSLSLLQRPPGPRHHVTAAAESNHFWDSALLVLLQLLH